MSKHKASSRGKSYVRFMDLSATEELYDIYDDIDVVKRIKIQRVRWLGHVLRMDSSNPVRKVFESEPGGGSRRQGWHRQCWAKQVDENLTTLGIRNWRQAATACDVWRRKLSEAKSCNRLQCNLKRPLKKYIFYAKMSSKILDSC